MIRHICFTVCILLMSSQPVFGQTNPFKAGTVIEEFGQIANVDSDVTIPEGTVFKIRFDVGDQANPGSINRSFNSAARLLNLQVAVGVPLKNNQLAIVVHGSAAKDLLEDEFYKTEHENVANASTNAVATLQKHGVRFFLCGQSAAYHHVSKNKLIPGVKVAPSAMTIHALLDLEGYSLNPF